MAGEDNWHEHVNLERMIRWYENDYDKVEIDDDLELVMLRKDL
jgi:hypothetical protein